MTNLRDEFLQIMYDPLVPTLCDLEAQQLKYAFSRPLLKTFILLSALAKLKSDSYVKSIA